MKPVWILIPVLMMIFVLACSFVPEPEAPVVPTPVPEQPKVEITVETKPVPEQKEIERPIKKQYRNIDRIKLDERSKITVIEGCDPLICDFQKESWRPGKSYHFVDHILFLDQGEYSISGIITVYSWTGHGRDGMTMISTTMNCDFTLEVEKEQ